MRACARWDALSLAGPPGPLKGALAVQVFKQIAFMGLIPRELMRGDGAHIEAFDIGGREQVVDQRAVFCQRGHHEARPNGVQHFRLWDFHHARKREQVFGIRQGVYLSQSFFEPFSQM